MAWQEQQTMDPKTAVSPPGRGREYPMGAEPTPEPPACSVQVPSPILMSAMQQASVDLRCMIFGFIGILSTA